MKRILILLSLFLLSLPVFSQYLDSDTDSAVRIIEINFSFNEPVRTRGSALEKFIFLKAGQEYSSLTDLETAVTAQVLELENTRYYESVNIDIIPTVPGSNQYVLHIALKDGVTFVPIPYPIPKSSVGANGWSFGAEISYDNAFGSMTDLVLEGSVDIAFAEEEQLKAWEAAIEWNNIRLGKILFDTQISQNYLTSSVTDPNAPPGLGLLQHFTNHETFLRLSSDFSIADRLVYTLSPQLGFKYLYDYTENFEGTPVQNNSAVIEDRMNLVLTQGIQFGEINWQGPLREGSLLTLNNSLRLLNSHSNDSFQEYIRFTTDFELIGAVYKTFGKIFNYYSQVRGIIVLNGYRTGLGEYLRAVQDSSMYGNIGLFWQNSLGIEIWGDDKIHIQFHPFLDMGISSHSEEERNFSHMYRIGFGAEGILMIGSVDIRGSLGYDPVSDEFAYDFSTGLSY